MPFTFPKILLVPVRANGHTHRRAHLVLSSKPQLKSLDPAFRGPEWKHVSDLTQHSTFHTSQVIHTAAIVHDSPRATNSFLIGVWGLLCWREFHAWHVKVIHSKSSQLLFHKSQITLLHFPACIVQELLYILQHVCHYPTFIVPQQSSKKEVNPQGLTIVWFSESGIQMWWILRNLSITTDGDN